MFIKESKQLTRNFTNPLILTPLNNNSYQLYLTQYKFIHNKKSSWYRKKKKKALDYWFNQNGIFSSRYMIISRFHTKAQKYLYDVRINSYGTIYTAISSWGLNYGRRIFNLFTKPKYYYFHLGLYGQELSYFGDFFSFIFHHFYLNPRFLISSSPGTYIRVLSRKRNGLLTLLLPSKLLLKCKTYCTFIVGRNEGVYWDKMVLAKSGYKNKIKSFVKVRGIAKNPVDHPNGGNSNTKGSLRNPWGYFAKKGK